MQSRYLLALLPLLACDSGSDVEPRSGTWTYGGSEVASNTCGADPLTDPAGPFTLGMYAHEIGALNRRLGNGSGF